MHQAYKDIRDKLGEEGGGGEVSEVWKVVTIGHEPEVYVSEIVSDIPELRVEYQIGQRAYPQVPGTGLFAFATRERAMCWLLTEGEEEEGEGTALLRCAYKPHRLNGLTLSVPNMYSLWYYSESIVGGVSVFWSTPEELDQYCVHRVETWPVPIDTVICEWIEPLQLVEWRKGSEDSLQGS